MRHYLLYYYLNFVALTSRIQIKSETAESILILRESRPAIYTFWHEKLFFLIYFFSIKKIPLFLSPKNKEDSLAQIATRMKMKIAKGSFESGGRHALMILLEQLKQGTAVAIPADGAHGPAKKSKAGCFILAQETNLPLIAMSWNCRFKLKGKISIPFPFSRIEIKLAKPIYIPKHYQFSEFEDIKLQLENIIENI